MKGFIEVTSEAGFKELVNINHIEAVINQTIYLDAINIICEESYEEIKAKIAEAVGEKGR